MNSSMISTEPMARRKIQKLNSNSKIVPTDQNKVNPKESLAPLSQNKTAKRQQSLLNVNLSSIQEREAASKNAGKLEKRGPGSSSNTKRNLSHRGDAMKETDQEYFQGSPDKPNDKQINSQTMTQKKSKLKGPKIEANLTGAAANKMQAEEASSQAATDNKSLSIVTKLRSWEEFFEPEELQTGINYMKQSMKALTERSDEDDEGSDSEPSVDNYEQDELEDNLQAALDPEDIGETNPFERPFEEEEPTPSVKIPPSLKAPNVKKLLSEKEPSEDGMSMNSGEQQQVVVVPKEEVESQQPSEEEVVQTNGDSETTIQESDLKFHSDRVQHQQLPVSLQIQKQGANKIELVPRRGKQTSKNRANRFIAQLEQERQRIVNHPDLANQLINQLIQQNNARQMKSSAAPPSGLAQQFNTNNYNQELTQNTVLRGQSYHQNLGYPIPAPSMKDPAHEVYKTEEHRRMNRRNPSTQFSILGQGVSLLNTTQQPQSEQQQMNNIRQNRKVNLTVKDLIPLPVNQLNQQFQDEANSSIRSGPVARRVIQDARLNRQNLGSGAMRGVAHAANTHSEIRQATRLLVNSKSPNQNHMLAINRGGRVLSEGQKQQVEQSQDVANNNNSYSNRSYMNDTMGSATNSKMAKAQNVRNSQQRFYKASVPGGSANRQNQHSHESYAQKYQLQQQRIQEAHKYFEPSTNLAIDKGIASGLTIHIHSGQVKGKHAYNQSQDTNSNQIQQYPAFQSSINSQTLELRKAQQNREKQPLDSGRYSHNRHASNDDSQFVMDNAVNVTSSMMQSPHLGGKAATVIDNAPSNNRLIHQFAYSPLQREDSNKRPFNQNEMIQMSAPHVGKKQPFSTPRHQRNAKNHNFKQAQQDALFNIVMMNKDMLGGGLEVRGNESSSGYNSAAYQTGYSGNFLGDPSSTNSQAMINDRKYSEMNSTYSQFNSKQANQGNNYMNSPNGFDVHKDIVKRSTGINTKNYHQATAGIHFEVRDVNSVVQERSKGDQLPIPSYVESQKMITTTNQGDRISIESSANEGTNSQTQKYRTTPIIVPGKDIKIRQNRNLKVVRQNNQNREKDLLNEEFMQSKITPLTAMKTAQVPKDNKNASFTIRPMPFVASITTVNSPGTPNIDSRMRLRDSSQKIKRASAEID